MIYHLRDFPRQLQIGDHDWDIKFCRRIPDEPETTLGLCDPSDHTIYIKLGQTPMERFKTLVHEVLHALEHEFEFSIPHPIVDSLEEPLVRLLLDNGLAI